MFINLMQITIASSIENANNNLKCIYSCGFWGHFFTVRLFLLRFFLPFSLNSNGLKNQAGYNRISGGAKKKCTVYYMWLNSLGCS